jgi:quercetin dioxygenase-like cupin family protein
MKKIFLATSILILVSAAHSVFAQSKAVDEAQENSVYKRLTPTEINSLAQTGAGAGTSGVSGIQTRILKGDPTKAGLYTIQLTIPPNTRIEAHDHPDDRVATVISGTWYFGYGSVFDEKELKALTSGSFYTEPSDVSHFARTGKSAVVIQITGYGPTGTQYTKK